MNEASLKDENERIRSLIELDKSRLPSDGGSQFNRLIFSTSPYLLQHSTNPVDWYPWGVKAFEKAASEDKPIFLSIGYATCHWCHIMEHESFENQEVAAVFNRSFVCIKVDREERPDIDEQYMTVAQMMTGSGGWPLNIFMTPEKKPFFAATYLPRMPAMGMPGIIQILERVALLWRTERQRLEQDASAIIKALGRHLVPHPGQLPGPELLQDGFRQLTTMYDEQWGGFGDVPKFPMPVYLSFLLRFWKRTGTAKALSMVEHSLRMLRQGGVYDQLGFGCHRYAVDRQWLVPHFEKMLYDQALIASACLETFQATGNSWYRQVAEEIFAYVLEEMTSQDGGFFAGQDADSEGEEGICYLWTPDEIAAVIGPDEAGLFCRLFGVTPKGNFEGRNILHLPAAPEKYAARERILPELLVADMERWRRMLLTARRERIKPFRDEKVITAWNGLMIAAMSRGYALSGEERFLAAAQRSAGFIGTKLAMPGGRLLRSFYLGEASIPAFLEDYAFFIWGLIELHQVTLQQEFLDKARTLAGEMLRLFGEATGKGLYETGHDSEQLLVRQQSVRDGVLPSGSSMAAFGLFRLGRITGENSFLEAGQALTESFMGDVFRQPLSALNLISAADYQLGPEVTVTLSGERGELEEMLLAVHRCFIPNLAIRYGGDSTDCPTIDGLPTAYVCAKGACLPPVTGAAALGLLLYGLE